MVSALDAAQARAWIEGFVDAIGLTTPSWASWTGASATATSAPTCARPRGA
jgi:hypothetical protein